MQLGEGGEKNRCVHRSTEGERRGSNVLALFLQPIFETLTSWMFASVTPENFLAIIYFLLLNTEKRRWLKKTGWIVFSLQWSCTKKTSSPKTNKSKPKANNNNF